MTQQDMARVMGDFVRATRYAERAGFDLIELHFAHGYLLATFLSPLTNQRTDAYGGSLENRMRFPLEVFEAVRAAWPEEKPIAVRLSAHDWMPGGFVPEDAVTVAKALKERGCDIIDVSSGNTVPQAKPRYERLFQTPFAERVRLEAQIPTMTVGLVTSYADVNSILAAGRADLCVLARAHLYDPYWTHHAAHDQGVEADWPGPYRVLDRFNPRLK
jgi:anthraniloyl-CoA monooxygenase